MVNNTQKLEAVVSLYRQLDEIKWENDVSVAGTFKPKTAALELLSDIDKMSLDLEVRQSGAVVPPGSILKIQCGQLISVTLRVPRYPQAFFARSFKNYLPNHEFRLKQPELFYLADKNLLIKKGNYGNDPLITAYLAILRLIDFIETNNISDHHPPGPDRTFLFFGHQQKFRLAIEYTADNIIKNSDRIEPSISRLINYIEDGLHKTDKQLILKKTLIEMLAPQGETAGFSFLIENISELVNRYIGNFELFAGKYTFDDEKQKLLIEIRDYFRSINDAISSAQLRLVAIPFTLLIISSRMVACTNRFNTLANTTILIGELIFLVLMGRLTHSQYETLTAEEDEIKSRKRQLKEQYPELYGALEDKFLQLDKRLNCQRTTLKIINGSLIIICIISVYTFFYCDTHVGLQKLFFP